MMEKIKRWLHDRRSPTESSAIQRPLPTVVQRKLPNRRFAKPMDQDLSFDPDKASPNSGDDRLIRNRFVREDTGTHETFTILDDSMIDAGDETGIDPYNTGAFDRSKTWDKRFRK